MSIYTDKGYKDRNDYLNSLAENNGVPKEIVFSLADILGETEDFDGLVIEDDKYLLFVFGWLVFELFFWFDWEN
jgi:hypothetical protein